MMKVGGKISNESDNNFLLTFLSERADRKQLHKLQSALEMVTVDRDLASLNISPAQLLYTESSLLTYSVFGFRGCEISSLPWILSLPRLTVYLDRILTPRTLPLSSPQFCNRPFCIGHTIILIHLQRIVLIHLLRPLRLPPPILRQFP